MPDGSVQIIVSKYIVGADGSKSAIRNFLNIPYKGKTYSRPIYILDCGAISEMNSDIISFAFSRKSIAGFFPLRNQRWRIDGSIPGRVKKSKNITLETVNNSLNFNLKITDWFSVSHSQQKYARTIRVGNCFLAGDSAHVNTPVGAQGMNAGIQDAHNLAWKLAFVIKQKAKPELLDSYTIERLGITKGFARYADAVYKMATNTSFAVRLFRTHILKIFFKSIFPKLENKEKSRLKFFKSISQIDIHYKPAFGSFKDWEKLFLQGTPKPCHRFPYLVFSIDNQNTNSHQILNASRFTLVVLAEELTLEIKSISEKYNLATVLLKHCPQTDNIYKSLGIRNTGYYLIRPDMYIELRSATSETEYLNWYLNKLFITHKNTGLLSNNENTLVQSENLPEL